MKSPALAMTAAALMLAACAAPTPLPTTNQAELKGPRPGMVPGYLKPPEVLDAIAVVAPPPKPGSAAQAADDEAYRAAVAAKDSPRWRQAVLDAEERNIHKALQNFSCALGVDITERDTPHLLMLARRSMTDIGVAYDKGKDHYSRTRPYAVHNGPSCTPGYTSTGPEARRSYPSGHAAVGWGLSLVLVETAPDRATQLARRGREFAQSRVACGVHWQSDVDAGRDVGAAVVAQLHGNEQFLTQLAQARKEVATARAAGARPTADCAAEAAALDAK